MRSGSVASYVAGGKRGSSASAISATSEKGELIDTFSKLNVSPTFLLLFCPMVRLVHTFLRLPSSGGNGRISGPE